MASASPREIKLAFEALTDIQLAKLKKYCGYRLKSLGLNAYHYNVEDIMQEVFRRIFETRTWEKDKCEFDYHLKMTISSVVDEYKKKHERHNSYADVKTESDIGTKESEFSIENSNDHQRDNTDERDDAKEELSLLMTFFENFSDLKQILALKMEGYESTEITQHLKLTDLEYKKMDKMLRRKLKEYEEGKSHA